MKLRRRELSQTIFNVVGLLVILSMVLGGLLVTIVPPSRPTPTPFPTRLWPTPTPTGTPSPGATVTPTTTPSPTATPRATSRPTDSPTATPAPTNTPLPSATVTSTITPTVTPTTTPVAGTQATPIPLGSRDIENFTFAVCGDSRSGQAIYQEILRRVEEDGAAFLVNTGDLVEFGQASEFQALARSMSDFSLPFYPVPGNHDTSDGSLDEFIRYSGAPAAHYSFDYGLSHFVIADSHMGFMSPRELDWLEVDLAVTDRPLKMVFVHHPPFDPDGTNYTMGQGYDTFMALIEEYAVSYVFAGHIHAYAEETRNGVHYIVTGGAGAPLYTSGHPQAFYHYVRVTVNGTDVSTEVVRIQP